MSSSIIFPGVQTVGDLDAHAARSALRGLVARLFDAWDDGDAATVASLFAGGDVASAVADWRKWEPWSVHFLSNEQITVSGSGECRGTWLWLTASTIDNGATPAWSGGDLLATATWTPDGWRIGSLMKTDRFRTPYDKGWLAQPTVDMSTRDGLLLGEEQPPLALETVGTSVTVDDLAAEVDVRALVGELTNDLEVGRSAGTVAARWTADGSYIRVRGPVSSAAFGSPGLEGALEAEQAEVATYMRMVFSQSVSVHGDRAECRWRDLWCGLRDGVAVWVAHRYVAEAVQEMGGWRLARVHQHRVLDCAYDDGWPATEEGA